MRYLMAAVVLTLQASPAQVTAHTITGGATSLRIDQSATGFRFVSVASTAGGHPYGFESSPLHGYTVEDVWHVQFWDPQTRSLLPNPARPSNVGGNFFGGPDPANPGRRYEAKWIGCAIPGSTEVFDFRLVIAEHADQDALAFTCEVVTPNPPSRLAIYRVRFPILNLAPIAADPTSERLVWSVRSGVELANPLRSGTPANGGPLALQSNPFDRTHTTETYQGQDRQSMQFSAYYSLDPTLGSNLLFVGTRDVAGHVKQIRWTRRGPIEPTLIVANGDYLEYYHQYVPENCVVAGNSFAAPYPAILAVVDTGVRSDRWFDAAQFYRTWLLRTQPAWLGPPIKTAPETHLTRAIIMGAIAMPSFQPGCNDPSADGGLPVPNKCSAHPVWDHASRAGWQAELDELRAALFGPGSTDPILHRTDGWSYSYFAWPGQWFAPMSSPPSSIGLAAMQGNVPSDPVLPYFIPRRIYRMTEHYAGLAKAGALVLDERQQRVVVNPNRTICDPVDRCRPDPANPGGQIPNVVNGFPFLDSAETICLNHPQGRAYANAVVYRLALAGVARGIYLDADPWPARMICYAKDHDHPAGGGRYVYDALDALLSDMKAGGQIASRDPKFTILTELPNELVAGLADGTHHEPPYGHHSPFYTDIPLYDAVYHEYDRLYQLGGIKGRDDRQARADPRCSAAMRFGVANDVYVGAAIRGTSTLPSVGAGFVVWGGLAEYLPGGARHAPNSSWFTAFGFYRDVVGLLKSQQASGTLEAWLFGRRCRDPRCETPGTTQVPIALCDGDPPLSDPWVLCSAFYRPEGGGEAVVLLSNWTDLGDDASVPAAIATNVTINPTELGISTPYRIIEHAPGQAPVTVATGQSGDFVLQRLLGARSMRLFVVKP